jgi:hypothetical protein
MRPLEKQFIAWDAQTMHKQKIADASFSSNSTRGDARASNEVDAVAGRITNVITFANRCVLRGVAGGRGGRGGGGFV